MIVVDASVVVDLLLDRVPYGERIAARLASEGRTIVAPHRVDAEVVQAFRNLVLADEISLTDAKAAIVDLRAFRAARLPHGPFLARAFAFRRNVTVYDGLYLALAEALDAPLLTRDRALAGVPGSNARVEVLA